MIPSMFERLYHDITDPINGSKDLQKGPNVAGIIGAFALQKLVGAVRQLAYGSASDLVEGYTGVQENQGRLMLYAFCDCLGVSYRPTYLGAWIEEALQKEMDKNAEGGLTRMLGSIDCTHLGWKSRPMPWARKFHDRQGMRFAIAEAIAGHDMYFWHVCPGFPGSLSDIQVLGRSTITMAYLEFLAALTKYTVRTTLVCM